VAIQTAFSFLDFCWESLATSCIRGKAKTSNSTTHNGRRVIVPHQGKFVHFLGDLLEVLYVVVCQERIIHQICGDDVLVSAPRHQQLFKAPCGPYSFFS
jgi:hypothetical protein